MNILAIPNNVRRRVLSLIDDLPHNGAVQRSERHILVLRHLSDQSGYNDHYLRWLRVDHPAIARRIRLARLLPIAPSLTNVGLLVPWLQYPLRERMPTAFLQASRIEAACRGRKIPIINPVERLSVSIKSTSLIAFSGAGVRAARFVRLDGRKAWDTLVDDLPLPFFIREDQNHGGPIQLITKPDDLKSVQPTSYRHPVAIEYIETRGSDGLWEKYRYILFGKYGVPRHLIVSSHWIAREQSRVQTQKTRSHELAYLREKSLLHHETLNHVRNVLGLDVVAFDYGFDEHGRLVIWDANPFPIHWTALDDGPGHAYQIPTINRVYRTLTRFLVEESRIGEEF